MTIRHLKIFIEVGLKPANEYGLQSSCILPSLQFLRQFMNWRHITRHSCLNVCQKKIVYHK